MLKRKIANLGIICLLVASGACSKVPDGSKITSLDFEKLNPGNKEKFDFNSFNIANEEDAEELCKSEDVKEKELFSVCTQVNNIGEYLPLNKLFTPVFFELNTQDNLNYGSYGILSLRFSKPRCISSRVLGIHFKIKVTIDELSNFEECVSENCSTFRFQMQDFDSDLEPWIYEVPLKGNFKNNEFSIEKDVLFSEMIHPEWPSEHDDFNFSLDKIFRVEFVIALEKPYQEAAVKMELQDDLKWIFQKGTTNFNPFCEEVIK